MPVKTGQRNMAVLKIPELSHRRCHVCTQSLPESQQVDPQAWARWKEDTCNSRITKLLPGLAGIPIGKMPSDGPKTLRWPPFARPYLMSPSLDSHESGTLKERVAQAFRRYQERQILTPRARSIVRANWDKI